MIACGWFLFPSSLCQTPPSAAPTFRAFAQPAHRSRRLLLFHSPGRRHGHAWPRSAATGGALEHARCQPGIAIHRVFCRAILRLLAGHAKAAHKLVARRHRGRLWNAPADLCRRDSRACCALLRRPWTRGGPHRRQCRRGYARRRPVRTWTPARNSNQRGSSRSRNLALLNVAWGLGAIACPFY